MNLTSNHSTATAKGIHEIIEDCVFACEPYCVCLMKKIRGWVLVGFRRHGTKLTQREFTRKFWRCIFEWFVFDWKYTGCLELACFAYNVCVLMTPSHMGSITDCETLNCSKLIYIKRSISSASATATMSCVCAVLFICFVHSTVIIILI